MNTSHTTRTRILAVLGVLFVAILVLTIPSPVHHWFVSTKIQGVPLKFGALALAILFTPPAILSLILRKFDDDYVDEPVQDDGMPDHLASHVH